MGKGFAGFQQSVKQSFSGAQKALVAFGAVAAVAIVKAVGVTQDWAAQVRSLQRVTGDTAESASKLTAAASLMGIDVSKLNIGFGILDKNIVNGSKNFDQYNIATRDAAGQILPFTDILANVSDKYNSLGTQQDKAALAMNVFGKSGKDLIPILSRGSAGLQELYDKAVAAGLIMSQEDLDASKELSIAQRELGDAVKGAAIAIGTSFIPVAQVLTQVLTTIVETVQLIPKPVLAIGLAMVTAAAGILVAQKAWVALRLATEGSMATLTGALPLLASIGFALTVVSGFVNDLHQNFKALKESSGANINVLKMVAAQMDLSGAAFEHHSFAGFIAALDGSSDSMQQFNEKITPVVSDMAKLGLKTKDQTALQENYAGTVEGTTESIDAYVQAQADHVQSITNLVFAWRTGIITWDVYIQAMKDMGISTQGAMDVATTALDKFGKHVSDTGQKVVNFAGMTKAQFADWSSGVVTSITDTFSTLGTKTKDIFNVTQAQLSRDFAAMLTNAARFKADMTALMSLKPGSFGLSKQDLQQFEVFMSQQAPGYVDAFVNSSHSAQQRDIANWQATQDKINGIINTLPDDHTIKVKFDVTANVAAEVSAGVNDITGAVNKALVALGYRPVRY
jgi:hypothetical protein